MSRIVLFVILSSCVYVLCTVFIATHNLYVPSILYVKNNLKSEKKKKLQAIPRENESTKQICTFLIAGTLFWDTA